TESYAEQAFWSQYSVKTDKPTHSGTTIVEVPKELLKVSMLIDTVRFRNDHFVAIMGYGDLQFWNLLISRVYYVEGLGYNLFSVRKFCDSDLEVVFKKHMCFVRNMDNVDLLSGSRGSNLYTILLKDMMKYSSIYLLPKASKTKSWLWHRRLSHLNIGTINQLAKEGLVRGLVANQAALTSTKPPLKNDLYLLFQPMFDEYFKKSPSVVSITISIATQPPSDTSKASFFTTIDQDAPSLSTSPITKTTINLIQSSNVEEPNNGEVKFDSDTFTNLFVPLVTSSTESSSRIVDTSNMHTFQQPQTYIKRWIKDHLLVTIISNPSKYVSTRRQLAIDAMSCYFYAFLTKVKHKNYKEAMKESCWIKAMQEDIHELE
nr:integrase, catalytic region, zinc finger, CCHC-type, peptidase aspartic, catalytic [Tanacetum cinerariifolium]